jgi:methylthioribose-1-phosphate isomerase
LACGGIGTALGCLIEAHRRGTRFSVLADETRPLLQGARLTALELAAEGIPVAVIPDSAAPAMIARGAVQAVFVGADRIASNGDFANKIGTYSIALAASVHRIPFYVVAPMSTFDGALAHGQQIPIEERAATEVLTLLGSSIAAAGVEAHNPAFDVSEQATIHMEDTTPLEIVSGTGPTTADPVRSLWQTNSMGVRMVLDVSWTMRRSWTSRR